MGRHGNGRIDNGLELFGSAVEDGFAALARQDGNRDGKIDAADAIFAQLQVWRDVNGNGVTEAGELLTTEQAGMRSIDLAKTPSGADNAGNRVDYTGTFTRTDGRTGVSAAISFAVNQTLSRWTAPEGFRRHIRSTGQTGRPESYRNRTYRVSATKQEIAN